MFEAVADPVRRSLLERLHAGPARVVDLAADHDISRPAVSRHLRVLLEAGLVGVEDHGRERHYRLEPAALSPLVTWAASLAARPPFTERDLDGLGLEVRRTGRDRRRAAPRHDTHSQEDTA